LDRSSPLDSPLLPPTTALPNARQAARRALEWSPRLAEALEAMTLVSVMADRNWEAAEGSIREAINLAPRWPDAQLTYARFVLTPRGRFAEAAEQLRQALAHDEHRNDVHSALASTSVAMNEPESARPHIERPARSRAPRQRRPPFQGSSP
jgi:Tfp pilus assembly protein PilF